MAASAYGRVIQAAPAGAPATLNAPMAEGVTVDAGLKTRWREEDKAAQHP